MLENLLRRLPWLGITWCLLAIPCVGGCSNDDSLKWTEDVMLPDGRIVTLTRYQEFKGPHEIGDTPTESDYWLEFKHPESGELVRWKSNRDLSALALMMSGKAPRLLVTPNFGGVFRHKCPDPPYLLFEYRHGAWSETPLDALHGEKVRTNLTSSPKEATQLIRDSNYHLTSDQALQMSPGNFGKRAIDFTQLRGQTFGSHCRPPFNWMLEQ